MSQTLYAIKCVETGQYVDIEYLGGVDNNYRYELSNSPFHCLRRKTIEEIAKLYQNFMEATECYSKRNPLVGSYAKMAEYKYQVVEHRIIESYAGLDLCYKGNTK